MPQRLTDPRHPPAPPCPHAQNLANRVLAANSEPILAQIGIGATSLALCRMLDHHGEVWFFDFEDRVAALGAELEGEGFRNFKLLGNSRRTFDGYGWTLALLLRRQRSGHSPELFDFIYLDGAHVCHHDALATVCAKDLLKPNGYLLMGAYTWSFATSPTLRPSLNPAVRQQYCDTQIELSQVEMVCSLLLDTDTRFARIALDGTDQEQQRAYQKTA
jgi:hypothetical protein